MRGRYQFRSRQPGQRAPFTVGLQQIAAELGLEYPFLQQTVRVGALFRRRQDQILPISTRQAHGNPGCARSRIPVRYIDGKVRAVKSWDNALSGKSSIFLLDQTGFSQVKWDVVARILKKLPTAEVILTFAADHLVNFLADRPAIVQAVAPLDLTPQNISDLIQLKKGDGGRALVQRVLREKIRSVTNATYDTPFFIRPERSRRTLWFLHLSRHPTARDVMMQCHWNNRNTFEHYGPGGFEMLGWDNLSSRTLPLFRFGKIDEQQMRKQILDAMPDRLFALASEEAITIDAVRHELANETAARFSDMDSIILELFREKEIEILGADNKVRSSRLRKLRPHDRIAISKQIRMFFDIQRRR